MTIDYLNKDQLKDLKIKVNREYGRAFIGDKKAYDGVTFKNFPTLTSEDAEFKNCIFEDCQGIELSQCGAEGCIFRNVSHVDGHYTSFHGCTFTQCCSEGPFLTIDSSGEVDGCTFENITALGDDGFVVYSVYSRKDDVSEITNCKFYGCEVENEEKSLIYCCYYKRRIASKCIEIDNIDYESCTVEST